MIRSLYLFEDMGQLDQIKTAQLYSAACSVIRGVLYLQDIIDLLHGLTTYLLQSLYLSSCTLLRLLKTSFAKNLDTTSGEALFLSSVGLLQKLSIGNNAYHAKAATILSLLWGSEKVFKNADGSETHELRIRSRSTMSLVFDCFWWWREEFGGQPHVYSKRPTESLLLIGYLVGNDKKLIVGRRTR
jgi:transcriptional regulatory protein LEU3